MDFGEIEMGQTWPLVIGVLILLCCIFYLWEVLKSYRRRANVDLRGIEPFANPKSTEIDVRQDDGCYDAFYAKVYDQLVQPGARATMEVQVPLEWLKNQGRELKTIRVADLGCGTGIQTEIFAKQGVHSVVGYDRSEAMIAEARRRFPEDAKRFVVADVTDPGCAAAGQFDLVTAYYFLLYLIPDRRELLRNVYLWLAPGGIFAVHIVNKLKFDPVLESASPFVGFSIQKYADDRITASKVAFDEFEYTGDFQLNGARGVYEEEFAFKDGRIRRHEQRVWMPNIDVMVKEITDVGFKYLHHADLTPIGYEYQYVFLFGR